MPDPSQELQELATARTFDEVYEVVRVFTVRHQDKDLKVRVELRRYYAEKTHHYHLEYERENEHGEWESASYGQVLTGAKSEEQSIRTAISFIKQAHGLLA